MEKKIEKLQEDTVAMAAKQKSFQTVLDARLSEHGEAVAKLVDIVLEVIQAIQVIQVIEVIQVMKDEITAYYCTTTTTTTTTTTITTTTTTCK